MKSLETEFLELKQECADIPADCKLEDDDNAILTAMKLLDLIQNETMTKQEHLQVWFKQYLNYNFEFFSPIVLNKDYIFEFYYFFI